MNHTGEKGGLLTAEVFLSGLAVNPASRAGVVVKLTKKKGESSMSKNRIDHQNRSRGRNHLRLLITRSLLGFGLVAGVLASGDAFARLPRPPRPNKIARVRIRVRVAPPAARVAVVPVSPSHRHVWVAGYWRWDVSARTHVWVDGVWSLPPAGLAVWHPGHWEKDGDEWEWIDGHWS